MNVYVVLLRGINVGGRNSLPMKELTKILETLGCEEVRTYIQSGNVVLHSDASSASLARDVSRAIEERRGFAPHVLVLAEAELLEAVAGNPYPEAESDPRTVHLGFLDSVPGAPDLEALAAVRAPSERFELKGRVFYLHAPEGIGRSKLAQITERKLGVPMTDRNWRTVTKLVSMLQVGTGSTPEVR